MVYEIKCHVGGVKYYVYSHMKHFVLPKRNPQIWYDSHPVFHTNVHKGKHDVQINVAMTKHIILCSV